MLLCYVGTNVLNIKVILVLVYFMWSNSGVWNYLCLPESCFTLCLMFI